MPLIDTQTGAIEVEHTADILCTPAFNKPHIIEAFILIAGVRHRARSRTVFGSSSGGAGFSADAQQS